MVTIKDIARLSGYSIGTVSRVLNNRPDVSDEARTRILEVIRNENFQPNANAKHLKQRGTSAITVLVKGINNFFLETVLEEIQMRLRDHGEDVNVIFMDEAGNEVDTAIQVCTEQKPKGIVFLGANLNGFREKFSAISIPCVLVTDNAQELGFENLSSFSTDDTRAAAEAVDYLIRMGHQRIGILGGHLVSYDGRVGTGRVYGAIEELKKKGIAFHPETDFVPCRFSMEEGYDGCGTLMKRGKDLTAIFVVGDMIALGAMRALRDMGYRVPDDVSMIGFDGIEYTHYCVPRLATVNQDAAALAARSVEDLLMRISYSREAVHEMIPFTIIRGESVKDLR